MLRLRSSRSTTPGHARQTPGGFRLAPAVGRQGSAPIYRRYAAFTTQSRSLSTEASPAPATLPTRKPISFTLDERAESALLANRPEKRNIDEENAQKYGELWEQEVRLEMEAVSRAAESYREEYKNVLTAGRGAQLKPARKLIVKWWGPLAELIQEEVFEAYKDVLLRQAATPPEAEAVAQVEAEEEKKAEAQAEDAEASVEEGTEKKKKGKKKAKKPKKQADLTAAEASKKVTNSIQSFAWKSVPSKVKPPKEKAQAQATMAASQIPDKASILESVAAEAATLGPEAKLQMPQSAQPTSSTKLKEPEDYIKYMALLDAEKLAVIVIHEVLGACLRSPQGSSVRHIVMAIGEAVQAEVNFEKLRDEQRERDFLRTNERILREQLASVRPASATAADADPAAPRLPGGTTISHLTDSDDLASVLASGARATLPGGKPIKPKSVSQISQKLRHQMQANSWHKLNYKAARRLVHEPYWPPKVKLALGADLVQKLLRIAKYTLSSRSGHSEEVYALQHAFAESSTRIFSKRVIRLHPAVFHTLDEQILMKETSQVKFYPMVVPPQPWSGPEKGGYFKHTAPLIRFHSYKDQMPGVMARQEDLSQIYKALDVLGSTPWRLNPIIYNTTKQVWNEGGGLAEIPERRDLPMPLPSGPEGRTTTWHRQIRTIERHNYNLHSLRCDMLLKFEVADRFKDDTVYFPHNMDFRGRVYPVPPHLNHMGGDLARAMLMFAEARPLGERGLYWLKIHLANIYGKDKIPFEERIQFVDSQLEKIFDSAIKPLGTTWPPFPKDGERWWLRADDPWQCLAACAELHGALSSPDPRKFMSHLPIHQDGTCNGLQHYAALGGDAQGARSVNLMPASRPQDVYSDVAKLVQERIAQDALSGVPIAQILNTRIDRKVIKQTVMTSVYGVTFIGARKQIHSHLKDRGIVTEEQIYDASVYIAKKVFESLREMFTGAKAIMEWLATCAGMISAQSRLVAWVTPLGLPITQPYRKPNRGSVVHTALQQFVMEDEYVNMPVHKTKQRSAFPPNFVHSLDSSHMLLTALLCQRANVTYASVHDSFWTHASTVDQMNVILREAFVQLHKRPILQQLRDHFKKQHPDIDFPPVPVEAHASQPSIAATVAANATATAPSDQKEFDPTVFRLEYVKKSPYFFN